MNSERLEALKTLTVLIDMMAVVGWVKVWWMVRVPFLDLCFQTALCGR